MKTINFLICAFTLFLFSESVIISQERKFKFSRVTRDVKKMAKRYEKEGYKVLPGNPDISHQLNSAYNQQAEKDDQGFPKYIIANGASVANTQAAAQMQAMELAKQNLVSLIETNMRSVIEQEVGNNQLAAGDAASITKTMQVSVNKVAKKLVRVMTMFEIYRELPNKNIEVQILLGYNYALAQQSILDEMRLEMQQESEDMKTKYDSFLNPEKYKQGEIKNLKDDEK